jgi:hypothetical protein
MIETIKDVCRRYGLTSEKEDKKLTLTNRGYGAIGFILLIIVGIFAIFESKNSEITDFNKMSDGASGFNYLLDNQHGRSFVQTSFERNRVNGNRVHTAIIYSNRTPTPQLIQCKGPTCERSQELKYEFHCDINSGRLLGFRYFTGYHRTGSIVSEYTRPDPVNRITNLSDPRIIRAFPIVCGSGR